VEMYNLRSKNLENTATPQSSFKNLVKTLSANKEGTQGAAAAESTATPLSVTSHTPRRLYLDTLRTAPTSAPHTTPVTMATAECYSAPSLNTPTDVTAMLPQTAINSLQATNREESSHLIAYVSSPSDIPLFRGFATDTDPPRSNFDKYNPEFNVKAWLQRIDLFFAATNIKDDHARKHKLLTFTSPKFGDARVVIQNFLDPTYDALTYDDLKRQLIAIYDPRESSKFLEAAQAFQKCTIRKKTEQIAANVANIENTVRNTVRTFFDRMNYESAEEKRNPQEICEELLASILTANFFSRKIVNKVVEERKANCNIFTFYNDLRTVANNETKSPFAEEPKPAESTFTMQESKAQNINTTKKIITATPRWSTSWPHPARRYTPPPLRPPPPQPPQATYLPRWRYNNNTAYKCYPARPPTSRPWRNAEQFYGDNKVKSTWRSTYAK